MRALVVKYEDVYTKGGEDFYTAFNHLEKYFDFYNNERSHSSLGKKTPSEIYHKNTRMIDKKTSRLFAPGYALCSKAAEKTRKESTLKNIVYCVDIMNHFREGNSTYYKGEIKNSVYIA